MKNKITIKHDEIMGYICKYDSNLYISWHSYDNKIKDILFFNGYKITKPIENPIEISLYIWNQIKQYFFYSDL